MFRAQSSFFNILLLSYLLTLITRGLLSSFCFGYHNVSALMFPGLHQVYPGNLQGISNWTTNLIFKTVKLDQKSSVTDISRLELFTTHFQYLKDHSTIFLSSLFRPRPYPIHYEPLHSQWSPMLWTYVSSQLHFRLQVELIYAIYC